jgi:hypothetical protein
MIGYEQSFAFSFDFARIPKLAAPARNQTRLAA